PAYLARRFEKRILQRADSRFAITEFAVEHLQRKHGVRVELLPHTLDETGMPNGLTPMPADAPVVVHFAGSIYTKMNTNSLARPAHPRTFARRQLSLLPCPARRIRPGSGPARRARACRGD